MFCVQEFPRSLPLFWYEFQDGLASMEILVLQNLCQLRRVPRTLREILPDMMSNFFSSSSISDSVTVFRGLLKSTIFGRIQSSSPSSPAMLSAVSVGQNTPATPQSGVHPSAGLQWGGRGRKRRRTDLTSACDLYSLVLATLFREQVCK